MESQGSFLDTIKIGSKTDPKQAAASLAMVLKENGMAEMRCIGAAAVNNAVKAIAITRGYIAPTGADIVCVPAFEVVTMEDRNTKKEIQKTAIKFIVNPR